MHRAQGRGFARSLVDALAPVHAKARRRRRPSRQHIPNFLAVCAHAPICHWRSIQFNQARGRDGLRNLTAPSNNPKPRAILPSANGVPRSDSRWYSRRRPHTSVHPSSIRTASTPAPAAERSKVPRFPGSLMRSRTRTRDARSGSGSEGSRNIARTP
eukprot:scaffold220811_cov33-Tisochrysis_lutea.AAC.2